MASAPGIDREEQAGVAQVRVELLAGDAGLDGGVEILGMDGDDPVHPGEVERDAAGQGGDMTFERGAGTERDHGHAVLRADLDDRRDLFGRLGKRHRLGRMGRVMGFAAAVLRAKGRSGREAVAQQLAQRPERAGPAAACSGPRPCRASLAAAIAFTGCILGQPGHCGQECTAATQMLAEARVQATYPDTIGSRSGHPNLGGRA